MGMKLGLSHKEKKEDWGYMKTECWGVQENLEECQLLGQFVPVWKWNLFGSKRGKEAAH